MLTSPCSTLDNLCSGGFIPGFGQSLGRAFGEAINAIGEVGGRCRLRLVVTVPLTLDALDTVGRNGNHGTSVFVTHTMRCAPNATILNR